MSMITKTTLVIDFTHFSGVSIVDFEDVNAGWDFGILQVKRYDQLNVKTF